MFLVLLLQMADNDVWFQVTFALIPLGEKMPTWAQKLVLDAINIATDYFSLKVILDGGEMLQPDTPYVFGELGFQTGQRSCSAFEHLKRLFP